MKIWTVVADHTSAKIFASKSLIAPLQLTETLENPAGRLREQELETDKPGTVASSSPGAHANTYSSNDNATEHVLDLFVKKIGDYIRQAQLRNEFEGLRLVADPHVLGKLRRALDKHTAERVVLSLNKNLIRSDPGTIFAAIDSAATAQSRGPDGG